MMIHRHLHLKAHKDKVIIEYDNLRPLSQRAISLQKKSIFKKCSLFSIPLRTLCGLCVLAKPLGVLYRHPCRNPKPLSPGKGLSVGLPPSPRLGLRPSTPFLTTIEVFRQSVRPLLQRAIFILCVTAPQVKIIRNFPKTALLHLQKYRISVIMSIVQVQALI